MLRVFYHLLKKIHIPTVSYFGLEESFDSLTVENNRPNTLSKILEYLVAKHRTERCHDIANQQHAYINGRSPTSNLQVHDGCIVSVLANYIKLIFYEANQYLVMQLKSLFVDALFLKHLGLYPILFKHHFPFTFSNDRLRYLPFRSYLQDTMRFNWFTKLSKYQHLSSQRC